MFGQSQSSRITPDPAIREAMMDILKRAAVQSKEPYPQYTPEKAAEYMNYVPGLVSAMNPNQVGAGQAIAGLRGYTDPFIGNAAGLTMAGARPIQLQQFSPRAVNQYMSPYMSNVVDAAVANINMTNAQQQQQVLGNALSKGAYGGDRAGIAQAELARQQNLANNATIANLLNQGYGQALNEFNTQQQIDANAQLQSNQLAQAAAGTLGNLGLRGQEAAMQQAQAQYQYGMAQQQMQQAALSTAYQQYLQQQAFPYQQLSYYAGLVSGAAPGMGSTTTAYTPTLSGMQQAMGGIGLLGSLGSLGQMGSSLGSAFGFGGYGGGAGGAAGGGVNPLSFGQWKDGGRVGYAEGGVTARKDPATAYKEYNDAVASGASSSEVQRLYDAYLESFQGAAKPWEPTSTTTTPPEEGSGKTPFEGPRTTDFRPNLTGGNTGGSGATPPLPPMGEDANKYEGTSGLFNALGDAGKMLGGVLFQGPMGLIYQALNQDPKKVAASLSQSYSSPNPVADTSGGQEFANTTSGQTLREYMDQMKVTDPSQVKVGYSNVNGRWQPEFFLANAPGGFLHANAVPVTSVPSIMEDFNKTPHPAYDPETDRIVNKFTDSSGMTHTYPRPEEEPGTTEDLPAVKAAKGWGDLTPVSSGPVGGTKTGFTGELAALQHQLERDYSLPTGILSGTANVETGGKYDPNAINKSGSAGLFQFTPSTGKSYGLENPLDPAQAMKKAAEYFADLANQQGNSATRGSLYTAYNQGPGGYGALVNADPNRRVVDVYSEKGINTQNFDQNRFGLGPDATVGQYLEAIKRAVEKGAVPGMAPDTSQIPLPTRRPIDLGGIAPPTPNEGVVGFGNTADRIIGQNAQNQSAESFGNTADRIVTPTTQSEGIGSAGQAGYSSVPGSQSADRRAGEGGEPSSGIGSAGEGGGGVTGGGNYNLGNGYSVTPDGDVVSNSDSEGSSSSEGENRGGRIYKADAGGISMQYGLSTSQDLQDLAQSLAGAGVYGLTGSQEALAAKGVLPGERRGGRIHKQYAGSISATDTPEEPSVFKKISDFLYPGADTDAMRNEMMGLNPDGTPKYTLTRTSAAQPEPRPESREPTPRALNLAGYPTSDNPATQQEDYETRLNQIIAGEAGETFNGPQRRNSAVVPGSTREPIEKYTRTVVEPAIERMMATEAYPGRPDASAAPSVPLAQAASTPTAGYEPVKLSKTPIVNPNEAYGGYTRSERTAAEYETAMGGDGKQPAATAPAAPAEDQGLAVQGKRGSLIQPAAAITRSDVGGEGYRRYIAPTPLELANRPSADSLLNLQFFSSLIPGAGGAQLANAARNYAENVQQLQDKQEGYQKAQIEAEKGVTEAEKSRVEARVSKPAAAAKDWAAASMQGLGQTMFPVIGEGGQPPGLVGVPWPKKGQATGAPGTAGTAVITGRGEAPITGEGNAPISGGGAKPPAAGTPEMPMSFGPQMGPEGTKKAIDTIDRYVAQDMETNSAPGRADAAYKAFDTDYAQAKAEADQAMTRRRDLNTSIGAYTMLGDSKDADFTSSGPFSGERQNLANYVGFLNNMLGLKDNDPNRITEADITAGQLYKKMSTLQIQNASAREALGWKENLQASYPNADQTKLTQASILATFLVNNQSPIDKRNFMDFYASRMGVRAGTLTGQAYDKVASQAQAMEKEAIIKMLMATGGKGYERKNAISMLLEDVSNPDPKARERAIKQFNDAAFKIYGISNMSRIFIGE
jgi:hypothetical protein